MSSQPQLGMFLSAAIRYIVCGFILNLLPKRPASVLRAAAWTLAGTPRGKPSLRRPLTWPAPRVSSPMALPALDAQRLFPKTTPPAVRTTAAPPTSRQPNRPLRHHADSLRQSAPPRLKSFLEKTLTRASHPAQALLAALLLTACNPTPTQDLHVFAAASLREALTEAADAFQQANPEVRVVSNFAGSQVLRLQIESGARADLFLSANPDHLDALYRAGLLRARPTVVATNALVLAVPAGNPASVSGIAALTQPGRRVVMAAESVPAGAYARRMLALHAAATGQPAICRRRPPARHLLRDQRPSGSRQAGTRRSRRRLRLPHRRPRLRRPPASHRNPAPSPGHRRLPRRRPPRRPEPRAGPALPRLPPLPQAQAILTRHGFAPAA